MTSAMLASHLFGLHIYGQVIPIVPGVTLSADINLHDPHVEEHGGWIAAGLFQQLHVVENIQSLEIDI